jgi:Flp pilus assembly protein TadB
MSKERAQRRAERLATAEAQRAARERRRRWRAALRRIDPRRLVAGRSRHRTGKLFARRNRPQRAAIASGVLIALVLVWLYVDSISARIAFTILIAVTTPAVVVLTLDRRI